MALKPFIFETIPIQYASTQNNVGRPTSSL